MKRITSILLIISLMLLHQECRVSNIDPQPVTTVSNNTEVTINAPPKLKDNVYIVDSNSIAEIVSFTETEFVYKGRLTISGQKGGRKLAGCLQQGDKLIFSDNGLVLEVAECPKPDDFNLPFGLGTVTLKHTGKFDFDVTDLFLTLNFYFKVTYTKQFSEDKFTGTSVSNPDTPVSFGYVWQPTASIGFGLDLSGRQLKTFGGYMSLDNVFSLSTQNLDGTFNGPIFSKEKDIFTSPPIPILIGPAVIPVTIKLSASFDVEASGTIKAKGNLFTIVNKTLVGFQVQSGGLTPSRSPNQGTIRFGEASIFEKAGDNLTLSFCVTPTISLSIFKIPGLPQSVKDKILSKTPGVAKALVEKGFAKVDTILKKVPPLLTVSEGLKGCVNGAFTCNTDKPGVTGKITGEPLQAIIFTADVSWVNYINKILGNQLIPPKFDEPYPTRLPKIDLGSLALPINCTPTSPSAATASPGPCISSTIVTYLSSPVTVGKRGLAGFASLEEGAGTTPPVFNAGSVFGVIPTLHSSTRNEDAIYVEKDFGELRLRFTYPDGKLKIEIRQYDEANNLLLNEQSTSAEVTGQGDVFRICATMSGSTNGKTYSNRVVIMGRLNDVKNAISQFNYVMLVQGGNTSDYLLNGRSIRVFRADRNALIVNQFRMNTDDQHRAGSNLSLMTR